MAERIHRRPGKNREFGPRKMSSPPLPSGKPMLPGQGLAWLERLASGLGVYQTSLMSRGMPLMADMGP